MTQRTIFLALFIVSIRSLALAQLPQTISYQGLLTTSVGAPISDGSYTLTFKLYTSGSGGSPLWTEAHSGVPVSKGTFSVILGSVTPLAGVNLNQQLYLGMTKGSDSEFVPRSMLTSAPSSLAPWALSDTNISFTNGRVGIGTAAPSQQLEITGNFCMPMSTATTGIIFAGTQPVLHTYGDLNFFAGQFAGNFSMTGYQNVGIGRASLNGNTSGYNNTAIGAQALEYNSTGNFNCATGMASLYVNTSGSANTADGFGAITSNTTGSSNTAMGYAALFHNSTNSQNTAIGSLALYSTTASNNNTAVGANAGKSYDNGYNNVFVGANTDVNGAGYYNVIAIGQSTVVTGSSTARFGNSSTVSYGGWANWSNVSDGRFKKNIKENVPGLEFFTKLRPITYTLDATGMDAYLHKNDPHTTTAAAADVQQRALREKEAIVYTGFVAQEVEAAAREVEYDFSGVDAPKNANDYYGLRYAEFVVPLVKAVQEQQQMIDELKKQIQELKARR